ncbi:hypothetical protein GPECTOR_49g463 [Gonium pectorale]|uniref:Integrase catalytic domain-containing protein n=1 Tax=Gonium pectorale TaxID=33097 RepID=A0A150G7P2_GONPE|nr:hypothetical protein GPECTOR_49g463 [Gonium pectorale]|eukprot:KXZ45879.1 hypothetical protein GPECTOR_49g463 [Gonium pectorale]
MLASETISGYLARARVLTSEIKAVGIVLDMTLLMIIVLRGLPIIFQSYVAAFYVTALPENLEELESKLLPIEQSMAAAAKAEEETVALFSAVDVAAATVPAAAAQAHLPECKYCGKTNHPEDKCHKGKRLQRKAAITASAGAAKALEEPVIILSVLPQTPPRGATDYPELPSVPEAIKASWVVDPGAAVHITPKGIAALTVKALRDNAQALLWHQRYGHLSYEGLAHLVEKGLVKGIPVKEEAFQTKVKFVRTDRGREYVNKELSEWYGQKGITDQTTTGYAPEQNGVAERLNRTLLDKARALLKEDKLPLSFWGDAFIMASHLRNRSPVHKRDQTPWELFTGQVPDVSGFRVFGCRAYVHIPKQKRTKLGLTKFDTVARPGIYIGPAVNAKAYRILLDDGTVQISRDVTFDEFVHVKPEKPVLWEEDSPKVPAPEEEAAEERAEPAVAHEVPVPPAGQVRQVVEEQADDPAAVHGDGAGSCGVRRSERVRKQPERFIAGSAALPVPPDNIEEAKSRPDWPMWKKACDEEIASLYCNNTWTLVQVSRATRVIGVKWVFSYEFDASGNIERYKARLVAKGYSQVAGIDFDEVFAPVSKHATLRAFLSVVAVRDLELHQLDVKTAFLNGELEDDDLHVAQLPGYEQGGRDTACRLNKALYGLRQASRTWYERLRSELKAMGFKPSESDPGLFVKEEDGDRVFLLVYVDDLLIAAMKLETVAQIKSRLMSKFEIRDLGEARFFLGYEIERDRAARTLKLSQKRYAETVLAKFGMEQAHAKSVPMIPGTVLEARV